MITHYITKAAMEALVACGAQRGKLDGELYRIELDEEVTAYIHALEQDTDDETHDFSLAVIAACNKQFGRA